MKESGHRERHRLFRSQAASGAASWGAFAAVATAGDATTPFESQKQNRLIIGVAYWFPHLGSVSSALLFDYDAQKFEHLTTAPVRASR